MGAITLLQNGLLATFTNADGPTATPAARRADVLIDADGIVQVAAANSIDAAALSPPAAQVIDCSNKWIAPGFVDTHRQVFRAIGSCKPILSLNKQASMDVCCGGA